MPEITVKWSDLENAAAERQRMNECYYQAVLKDAIKDANKKLTKWMNDIRDGKATLNSGDAYTIEVPVTVDNIRLLEDLNRLLTANGFFAWQKNGKCFLQKYEKQ